MGQGTCEIYRCFNCHRLVNLEAVLKAGHCSCGSRRVTSTYPINIWEWIKVTYWYWTGQLKSGSVDVS